MIFDIPKLCFTALAGFFSKLRLTVQDWGTCKKKKSGAGGI
jgi:hypothetical protein